MKNIESNSLISEHIGRSAVRDFDESILEKVPKNAERRLDPFSLSTEFGSSGGLMSEFDIAIRLDKTLKRLTEIEYEAVNYNIELPR